MKRIISVILVVAMLFAVSAILPVQAAVDDSAEISSEGVTYRSVFLNPGDAYRENTKWYAWIWPQVEGAGFEDGFWMSSSWVENEDGNKMVYFNWIYPNAIFVCVPDDSNPSWDDAIYQSPEIDVPGDGYTYKVTSVSDGEKLNITGEWKWIVYPDDPYASGEVTHSMFTIVNPVSTGTYHVNEDIPVMVGINGYITSYSANGSKMNYKNSILLEIRKNKRMVYSSYIQYRADSLGSIVTNNFKPSEFGVYTVRVGFSKREDYAVSDSNYIGSYTFKVSSNTTIGDLNGDKSVDVLDATTVQKHSVGKADLTPEQIAVADVNNDNNVDILDAAEIQKFAAGKITEFKKKA